MLVTIDQFIGKLASSEPPAHSTNQYAYHPGNRDDRPNSIRRNNLKLYLTLMLGQKPDMLWVGEAPGYRGCLQTGVPFTSEFILIKGESSIQSNGRGRLQNRQDILGAVNGFEPINVNGKHTKESTATMVWRKITSIDRCPLLWNAFPYHPYYKGDISSNRTPKVNELILGEEFIRDLRTLFGIENIAAIGRKAEITLRRAGMEARYIPHPSHGRKLMFDQGIDRFIESLR